MFLLPILAAIVRIIIVDKTYVVILKYQGVKGQWELFIDDVLYSIGFIFHKTCIYYTCNVTLV